MRSCIKPNLIGSVLTDGSFIFFPLFSFSSQPILNIKNIDCINHSIWAGKRPKEQTEISTFIKRLNIK